LEPALRGEDFAAAFEPFRQGMRIDRVPEPLRAEVLASQDIRQELVLGYWEQIFRLGPDQMQAQIDAVVTRVSVPCLCLLGRQLSSEQRRHLLEQLPQAQFEEWPDRGHLVHLTEADRFTTRLRSFVEHCTSPTTVS
jgi:pimeloyl-ACP methyl ester carboxylesterase